jgi:hypothetical protein
MPRSVQADDSWGERVAKLLPAEATALFVTVNGFVSASGENLATRAFIMIAVAVVTTACVPIFLTKIYKVENASQIAICTLSFPLWAMSINPKYLADILDKNVDQLQLYISIATVFVASLGPLVLPKQPAANP